MSRAASLVRASAFVTGPIHVSSSSSTSIAVTTVAITVLGREVLADVGATDEVAQGADEDLHRPLPPGPVLVGAAEGDLEHLEARPRERRGEVRGVGLDELVREVAAPNRERYLADSGAHALHVARLAHEELGGVDPRRREHGTPVDAAESVEVAEAQTIGGRPGIAVLLPWAMGAGEPRLQGHDHLGVSGVVDDPGLPRDVGHVGVVSPTILRMPRGVLEIVDTVGKGDPRLPEGRHVAVWSIGIDVHVDLEWGVDGERLEVPHANEQRLL